MTSEGRAARVPFLQNMDNMKGSKLHSIIEKLSEQCVRADDESAPSEHEENDETSAINEDIVVVEAQPPAPKTYARTKFGKFKKVTKRKPPPKRIYNNSTKPKRTFLTSTKLIQAQMPFILQSSSGGPTLRKSVGGTPRKKLLSKPSQICQPVDEDLCIDVTALMSITPQVKDIDDHNYSKPAQTNGGNCRLCQSPVKNKKDFLKHFKKFHPECIKKPKKKAAPQPEPEEEEEESPEEEEEKKDHDASSSEDSDYDPTVDPDMTEAQDAVLTQRRSTRLAKREEEQQDKVATIKLALNKLPSTKKVTCQVCEEKFYFKIEVTSHLNEEHSISEITPDESNECEHCNKKYPSRERLMKHIKKVVRKIEKIRRNDEFYEILEYEDECDKILKEHKKLLQRFSCDKCTKKFVYKGSLNKHMAAHSEDRPFGCKDCGKSFKDKEYLRRHMLIHTGEKKYKCDICDRKLAHYGSLRSHRMIHTGERPYKCKHCDAGFISRYQLSEHEQIKHLGRAPHKCELCPKTFVKANHLKTHMISHSNEKPHSCEVCGKAFKRRDHLRYHLIIHSDIKPFKCDTCGRTFNQHICLRKHLPCREFERRAKKKEKSSTETKPKKSKSDKTTSSPSQPQQNEDVVPTAAKKSKSSTNKKNTKSKNPKENVTSTRTAGKDVEAPNKTPLNEPLPEQPEVSAPAVLQEAEKTNQTTEKSRKEPEESTQKRPKRSRPPIVTEKQSSVSKKPRTSTSSKTKLNHSIPTEVPARTALSTTSIPPPLERPHPHSMGMAPRHKDTNINFDRLDLGFQAPGPIVSGPTPGSFNHPMQRLLESSYISNMPQTFVPFNCTTPDTASVVFESGGLEIYQGAGSHDNMRALSHDSAATDLSSALLAAMDPDHINNLVNPASFFPQT